MRVWDCSCAQPDRNAIHCRNSLVHRHSYENIVYDDGTALRLASHQPCPTTFRNRRSTLPHVDLFGSVWSAGSQSIRFTSYTCHIIVVVVVVAVAQIIALLGSKGAFVGQLTPKASQAAFARCQEEG